MLKQIRNKVHRVSGSQGDQKENASTISLLLQITNEPLEIYDIKQRIT